MENIDDPPSLIRPDLVALIVILLLSHGCIPIITGSTEEIVMNAGTISLRYPIVELAGLTDCNCIADFGVSGGGLQPVVLPGR